MKKHFLLWVICVSQCFGETLSVEGKEAELEEELKFLAAERQVVVVTASKMEERVEKTISTTYVITQPEIKEIGARNLLDILKLIPGVGITQSSLGLREVEVRGVKTTFSEKVLFLLNGHPLDQNLLNAGSTWVYDDLPVDTVQRIEVVRGPGSALYGANAFLAVINIITQTARGLDGTHLSTGWGSFGSQQYRASFGKAFSEKTEAAVHFNFTDTNGIQSPISADALSTQSKDSLSPGVSQLSERRYDLEWQLGYEGFKLDGRFIEKEAGAFVGPQDALSNRTAQNYDSYFIRLSRDWNINNDLVIEAQGYYDDFRFNNLLEVSVPGYFNRAALNNTRTGGELQATYKWSDSSTVIGGASYVKEAQTDVTLLEGSDPKMLIPAEKLFNRDTSRDHWGVYVQNIWDPLSNLRFTLGARYDTYSRIGDTFNPRLGFNWEFVKNYSLKFSYGTAFRAPTFGELYLGGNPILFGNPSISPEGIETFETGIIAHPMAGLTTQAIYYHSRIGQIISLQPCQGPPYTDGCTQGAGMYKNQGSIVSEGVELEGRYDFGGDFAGSYLSTNYVYQNPEDPQGKSVPDVPHHRANIMLNWAFDKQWNAFAHVLIKGPTDRTFNTLPSPKNKGVPGYAVVNLSLLNRHVLVDGLDVSFTVYNLFDKKYYDPAPLTMPIDYQQAERAYFGHISFKF